MKRHIILLFLGLFTLTALSVQAGDIDSLRRKMAVSSNDTARLLLLKKIADTYLSQSTDSSMRYARKMLKLAKQKQMYYYLSDAFDLMCNVYEKLGNLDSCIIYYDSASQYATLIHDTVGVIYFTNNKAGIYIKTGGYFNALQAFEEVKKIGEKSNDYAGVAAALNNIGVVYHYLGDDKTSLDYFIQAYQLRLVHNITQKLAYSLNNIGAIYSKYGNYEEAIGYHKKAMKTSRELGDDYNYLVSLLNLGLDYRYLHDNTRSLDYYQKALTESRKQGNKTLESHALERMSALYIEMNSIQTAKPLLVKALNLAAEAGNQFDIASFSNSLGLIYLKEKKYHKALSLFTKALALSKEIQAAGLEVDVYKSLTAYYYSVNNPEKAFKYQEIFDTRRDSLYKAETDLKIANLKNRFELDLKMDELKKKEIELSSEKEISRQRLAMLLVVGGGLVILLMLIIYILMLYHKIKRKNLIIKENEEKVTRLLKKEKELGKLKTQLISTVSHEFRTPMAIISSNVQILRKFQNNMDEAMSNQTLNFIENSVDNMTTMLHNFDVLDQKSMLEFSPKTVNLRELLHSITNELKTLPNYNQRVVLNDKLTRETFLLDRSLITHIVRNLLINALKFSGNKPVTLVFGNTTEVVFIEVIDKGIGIPEGDIEKIFENFHRGKNAVDIKGTGVGMAVVKRCVDLHHGAIVVNSKINDGTAIKVTLPIRSD